MEYYVKQTVEDTRTMVQCNFCSYSGTGTRYNESMIVRVRVIC